MRSRCEDRPYLVMEFIPGESLEKKLERRNGQPLPEREALYYTHPDRPGAALSA